MSAYSVADAKANLPRLIDKALGGDEVVITRHGRPVAELRPVARPETTNAASTHAWLKARREEQPDLGINSVDLFNLIYEEK